MQNIKWEELRAKLLLLTESPNPVQIDRLGIIVDEKLFIKSQIAVVDSSVNVTKESSNREKHFKLFVAKPAYDRLLLYYYFKTTIETSFC